MEGKLPELTRDDLEPLFELAKTVNRETVKALLLGALCSSHHFSTHTDYEKSKEPIREVLNELLQK